MAREVVSPSLGAIPAVMTKAAAKGMYDLNRSFVVLYCYELGDGN